jgi:hypothetical protein
MGGVLWELTSVKKEGRKQDWELSCSVSLTMASANLKGSLKLSCNVERNLGSLSSCLHLSLEGG